MLNKRVFSINCKSKDLCQQLMEYLWKEGTVMRELAMNIKGDKLIITIYGLEHEIIETWNRIREIASLFLKSTSKKSLVDITYEELTKIAKKPFIPDSLVMALEILGYSVKYQGTRLITTAPLELIIELTQKIGRALEEIGRWRISPSVKKLLATAYVLDINLELVKEIGESLGVMRIEDFRIELMKDWKEALKEIVKSYKFLKEEL